MSKFLVNNFRKVKNKAKSKFSLQNGRGFYILKNTKDLNSGRL